MSARINPVDPLAFAPSVFVDKVCREYKKMPGAKRKIPREIRAQIYQLDLTIRESQHEIRRLLDECGIAGSSSYRSNFIARIRKERGA
jgi:hypothetical protein